VCEPEHARVGAAGRRDVGQLDRDVTAGLVARAVDHARQPAADPPVDGVRPELIAGDETAGLATLRVGRIDRRSERLHRVHRRRSYALR